jgi:hypothetical protein
MHDFDLTFRFEISEDTQKEIERIQSLIENKEIPITYPLGMIKHIRNFDQRIEIIKKLGYPLLSKSWIEPLAKWIGDKKCLEVMAGIGSLSKVLSDCGVNIIATDDYSWNGKNWTEESYWTNIEKIDAVEAVKKYGKSVDYIICSWAYMDDTLYRVLLEMREQNKDCKLIYIGEENGGCTADYDFFDNIKHIDDREFEKAVKSYQRWNFIRDHIQLGN